MGLSATDRRTIDDSTAGASIAVKAARLARIVPCRQLRVRLDYAQLGQFQQLLAQCEGEQTDAQFTDRVEIVATIPQSNCETFENRVREAFNAGVVPEPLGQVARPVPE